VFHLALYDEPLVESEFREWAHDPVNYELYNEYRDYGLFLSIYYIWFTIK